MSLYTNPLTIQVRSIARSLGLTGIIGKLFHSNRYEEYFDDAMFAAIRAGDVVWDVGANIGYYSRKFANAIGPEGKVFAIEPFPETVDRLKLNTAQDEAVHVIPMAMGAKAGSVRMQVGGDDIGATNKIVDGNNAESTTEVELITGDLLLERGDAEAPQIIKIDTEGFELDVLEGMASLLSNLTLRALFVEVHFGNLAERGTPNAPARIEALLLGSGFHVQWLDPSHLAAYRK